MKSCEYYCCLEVFGVAALAVSYPNIALWMSIAFRPFGYSLAVTAVTGFVYMLAFLPIVAKPTRAGAICTGVAVMGVAFGPFLGGAATLYARLSTLNGGPGTLELEAPLRAVAIVVDSGLPRQCSGLCAMVLDTHGVQAVRYIAPRQQKKRVFFSTDPHQPVPEATATYNQDSAAQADIAIEIGRMDGYQTATHWPKYQRWLLEAERGITVSIRTGGHNRVRPGPLVYERTFLSYQRPLWPAIYAPVTHGWTSGGNDGGIEPLRVRRDTPQGAEVDALDDVIAAARFRVTVAER